MDFSIIMRPFLVNTLALSLTVGLMVFIFSYGWSDKIRAFLAEKTFGSQKEIFEIMDKLLINQPKEKTSRNIWVLSLCLGGLVFFLLWPNVIFSLAAGAGVFLGVWIGIKLFLRGLWESHCNKVVGQMVEALTIMCNSLKVGLSLPQAMERVMKGFGGALAKEFRLVLNKTQLGQPLEEALTEMGERIQRPDIDMLVTTINILRETGGNLAETFFVMAETLRERQKMEKKIKALTASGMMQARIISALPFALIGIFYAMDKEYILPLVATPLGWGCLVFITILVCVGWFMMKKMVAIKV